MAPQMNTSDVEQMVMVIDSSPHQFWPSPLISISIVCSHQQRGYCNTVTPSELIIGAYKSYPFLSPSPNLHNRPTFIRTASSNTIVTTQAGTRGRMLGLNGEGGNKIGEKRGGWEYRVESWMERDETSICWRMRRELDVGMRGCLWGRE